MSVQGQESDRIPNLSDFISHVTEICNDLGNINRRLGIVKTSLIGSGVKESGVEEEKSPQSIIHRLEYLLHSATSTIVEIKGEITAIESVIVKDEHLTETDMG